MNSITWYMIVVSIKNKMWIKMLLKESIIVNTKMFCWIGNVQALDEYNSKWRP